MYVVYVHPYNAYYLCMLGLKTVSTRKIHTPFAYCGALEFFGGWLAVDTLPYDFYGTLCVVCNQNSVNYLW